jgi:hypothetical protein
MPYPMLYRHFIKDICPICNKTINGFFAVGYIFYFVDEYVFQRHIFQGEKPEEGKPVMKPYPFSGWDYSQDVLHTGSLANRLWDGSLPWVRHPFFAGEHNNQTEGKPSISSKFPGISVLPVNNYDKKS